LWEELKKLTHPAAVNDPFAIDDDGFNNIDLRPDREQLLGDLVDTADENPDLAPTPEEVLAADGPPAPPEPVAVEQPAPPAEPEGPQVHQYDDGTVVSIEKTSKGWEATLDAGTGGPAEVFRGRTKDEMFLELARGKANATRKIREQNRKEKLRVQAPAPAPAQPLSQPRVLSADDIFQIKTQLQSDPNLAMETWFQKRTGLTIDQLQQLAIKADRGAAAAEELDIDGVGKAFLANHPEYHPDDENLKNIVLWLGKYKLNPAQDLSIVPEHAAMNAVYQGGAWTVANLEEAFEDLSADGLLTLKELETDEPQPAAPPAPVAVVPPPPPAPPPAAPVVPNSRIASVRRRPNAALGVRPSAITPAPPSEPERAPSAEELDNLTDAQIKDLFSGVRKQHLSARR
jgi:hypothetical protein